MASTFARGLCMCSAIDIAHTHIYMFSKLVRWKMTIINLWWNFSIVSFFSRKQQQQNAISDRRRVLIALHVHFCYCYCRTLLEDTNFDFFQFYKLMFCHRMYSGSMLNDFVCRNRSSFPHRSSRQLNNKYAQLQQYTFSHSSISRTIYIIFLCSVPYSAVTLWATYPIYSDAVVISHTMTSILYSLPIRHHRPQYTLAHLAAISLKSTAWYTFILCIHSPKWTHIERAKKKYTKKSYHHFC